MKELREVVLMQVVRPVIESPPHDLWRDPRDLPCGNEIEVFFFLVDDGMVTETLGISRDG